MIYVTNVLVLVRFLWGVGGPWWESSEPVLSPVALWVLLNITAICIGTEINVSFLVPVLDVLLFMCEHVLRYSLRVWEWWIPSSTISMTFEKQILPNAEGDGISCYGSSDHAYSPGQKWLDHRWFWLIICKNFAWKKKKPKHFTHVCTS